MAFARVRFEFPPDTRYPGLPVRADGGRGLIYPLEGETHVTGPELVAALGQGADIEVLSGLVIPFDDENDRRPFAAFSRRVADVRSKYRGNAVALEKGAKEIGNACYGKTAQAVDGVRTTGNGVRVRGLPPVLARAGQRMEERFEDADAENAAWVELYRTRTYDLQTTRRQFISLRDQWKHVADLVELARTVRVNLEFDFKRRLAARVALFLKTRPWIPD